MRHGRATGAPLRLRRRTANAALLVFSAIHDFKERRDNGDRRMEQAKPYFATIARAGARRIMDKLPSRLREGSGEGPIEAVSLVPAAPPTQCQVNDAPRHSGYAGGITDLTLASGRGTSAPGAAA